MNRLALIVGTLLLLQLPAAADPLCLEKRNVRDYHAVDAHTVQFWMQDGTKWRSNLAQECPGLVYNGFVIYPTTSDSICENVQLIRVIENHQICRLGTFVKVAAPS